MSNWLGEAISQRQINYYEYSSFKNVQEVGKGAFGSVSSAWWESRGIKVALKTLINDCGDSDPKNEKFLKELLLLTKVNYHPNINQFLGLTEGL
ncbi:15327_t:CDS:2 [Acaulospora morrowiae]|uniref:15327_t:CDS:1 n=1 Tax=Acaulospora morrowiae TaxID=94023 RepID=A0A9N8WP94_9GLOM|nr:15327_t:CDS:2 [Acaulospora morrowiae]